MQNDLYNERRLKLTDTENHKKRKNWELVEKTAGLWFLFLFFLFSSIELLGFY